MGIVKVAVTSHLRPMVFLAFPITPQAFYKKLCCRAQGQSLALAFILLGNTISLGSVKPAWAERPVGLQFCAEDDEPRDADIFIAIAYHQRSEILGVAFEDWVSQGWYRLPKDSSLSCITLLDQPLDQRYYYFYAYTGTPSLAASTPRSWDGSKQFCLVPQRSYSLSTAELNCSEKGASFQGFREIDTLGAEGFRVVIE